MSSNSDNGGKDGDEENVCFSPFRCDSSYQHDFLFLLIKLNCLFSFKETKPAEKPQKNSSRDIQIHPWIGSFRFLLALLCPTALLLPSVRIRWRWATRKNKSRCNRWRIDLSKLKCTGFWWLNSHPAYKYANSYRYIYIKKESNMTLWAMLQARSHLGEASSRRWQTNMACVNSPPPYGFF